jgi:hypothetical protein
MVVVPARQAAVPGGLGFHGIDSWAPYKFKNSGSVHDHRVWDPTTYVSSLHSYISVLCIPVKILEFNTKNSRCLILYTLTTNLFDIVYPSILG